MLYACTPRILVPHSSSCRRCDRYCLVLTVANLRRTGMNLHVSLFLLRVRISVVDRANTLLVDTSMGKLREVVELEAAGCIEKVDLESLQQAPGGDDISSTGAKVEVFDTAYANSAKLLRTRRRWSPLIGAWSKIKMI